MKYKITVRPNMYPWKNFLYHVSSSESIAFKDGVAYVSEEKYLRYFQREPMKYTIEEVK